MSTVEIAIGCQVSTLEIVSNWIQIVGFSLLALWLVGQFIRELLIWTMVWWFNFKIRCTGCDGTGLCVADNPLFPHSCDGECQKIYVPESWVPPDFKGNWHEPGEQFSKSNMTWPFPDGVYPNHEKRYALIGCGWVYGNPWQRLIRGGPRAQLGIQNLPRLPEETPRRPCCHHVGGSP